MSPPDILDTVIKLELDKINDNIPQKRITLQEILKTELYSLPTKNSGTINILKEEILTFKEFFDESLYSEIRVPILVLNSKGICRVGGSKIDQWIIERLLGYIAESNVLLKSYEPQHSFYYPYQIQKLKRKFPNIIQLIYSF